MLLLSTAFTNLFTFNPQVVNEMLMHKLFLFPFLVTVICQYNYISSSEMAKNSELLLV